MCASLHKLGSTFTMANNRSASGSYSGELPNGLPIPSASTQTPNTSVRPAASVPFRSLRYGSQTPRHSFVPPGYRIHDTPTSPLNNCGRRAHMDSQRRRNRNWSQRQRLIAQQAPESTQPQETMAFSYCNFTTSQIPNDFLGFQVVDNHSQNVHYALPPFNPSSRGDGELQPVGSSSKILQR